MTAQQGVPIKITNKEIAQEFLDKYDTSPSSTSSSTKLELIKKHSIHKRMYLFRELYPVREDETIPHYTS